MPILWIDTSLMLIPKSSKGKRCIYFKSQINIQRREFIVLTQVTASCMPFDQRFKRRLIYSYTLCTQSYFGFHCSVIGKNKAIKGLYRSQVKNSQEQATWLYHSQKCLESKEKTWRTFMNPILSRPGKDESFFQASKLKGPLQCLIYSFRVFLLM